MLRPRGGWQIKEPEDKEEATPQLQPQAPRFQSFGEQEKELHFYTSLVFAQDGSKLVDNQTNQEFSAKNGPFLLSISGSDFVVKGQIVAFGQDTNRHWGFFVASVKGGKVKVAWVRADTEGVTLKPAKLEHIASHSNQYALLPDSQLEAAKKLVLSAARNTATVDEVCLRTTKRTRKKPEVLTYDHKNSDDEPIIIPKKNKRANKHKPEAAKDAAAANFKIKQLQRNSPAHGKRGVAAAAAVPNRHQPAEADTSDSGWRQIALAQFSRAQSQADNTISALLKCVIENTPACLQNPRTSSVPVATPRPSDVCGRANCQNPATSRCGECKLLYCSDCSARLHRIGNLQEHIVASLDVCADCEAKIASVRCTQCRVSYCETCSRSIHNSGTLMEHSISTIQHGF